MGLIIRQILNISISASWLILAVILARLLMRKAPKRLICLLWCLVGIRLLVPFTLESRFSLVPDVSRVADFGQELPAGGGSWPEEAFGEDGAAGAEDEGLQLQNGLAGLSGLSGLMVQPVSDTGQKTTWVSVFGGVWAAGAALMLLYLLGSWLRLKYRLKTSVRLRDGVWQSEYVESPFIFGLIAPRIYVPFSMSDMTLRYVLAHEKTHLKRKDNWTKALAFLILSIYWFHPLVWLSYALLCKDIEMACDERVISRMNAADRKSYSLALLDCHGKSRWFTTCPVGFGEVSVKERVVRIKAYKKPAFWIIIAAVLVFTVVAVCFMTSPRRAEDGGEKGDFTGALKEEAFHNMKMSYGDFLAAGGAEAEFYHGGRFISTLPDGSAEIIFTGEYDEDTAEFSLPQEAVCLRLQGSMKAFFEGVPRDMTTEEFLELLGSQYALTSSYEEGAGTAYYIANRYLLMQCDTTGDGQADTGVELSLDEGETIHGDTLCWVYPITDQPVPDEEEDGGGEQEGEVNSLYTLQEVMDRILTATPLTEAVRLEDGIEDIFQDHLVLLCTSESGTYEAYGFTSPEYGCKGMLLNYIIDGEDNWNYFYYDWSVGTKPPSITERTEIFSYEDAYHTIAFTFTGGDGMEKRGVYSYYETGHLEEESMSDAVVPESQSSMRPRNVREFLCYIKAFDGETLQYDEVEWVNVPSERATELGMGPTGEEAEDFAPSGFFIHNEEETTENCAVSEDCVCKLLDWTNNYQEMAVTLERLQSLLAERGDAPIPYHITVEDGKVVAVTEQYVP